jgi:hypothetical protein
MAYRKIVAGTANQSNETASHNKIVIEPGYAGTYLVLFLCILVTGSIIFMWIAHADILQALVAGTFIGAFVSGWIFLIGWTRRGVSQVQTTLAIDQAARSRAGLEAHVVAMTEHYILYKDEKGRFQFQASAFVTENRTIQPQIAAPGNNQDTILELHDKGMSARAIEKAMEKTVSYHQIQKILGLYRPEWNKKVIESDKAFEE